MEKNLRLLDEGRAGEVAAQKQELLVALKEASRSAAGLAPEAVHVARHELHELIAAAEGQVGRLRIEAQAAGDRQGWQPQLDALARRVRSLERAPGGAPPAPAAPSPSASAAVLQAVERGLPAAVDAGP